MKQIKMMIMLLIITFQVSAQTCKSTLIEKTGSVLSAAPGIVKITSKSNDIVVSVLKTGGKAETQINIYVDGQIKSKIEFDNGNYTSNNVPKTRNINGVKGKEIKIEIVNQSVANKFDYNVKIEGSIKSLMPNDEIETGNLLFNTKKTVLVNGSCTLKTKLTIKRVDGNARATITIYKRYNQDKKFEISHTFEPHETEKIIYYTTPNPYFPSYTCPIEVELKNISDLKNIKYSINAEVSN